MQKMYKDLMYPNTLRWYIHNYIPFKSTIKHMKDTVEDLRNESLTDEQIAYNRQRLQQLCFYSARQGECICGYMVYKSKQLDAEVQPMAEQAERYFVGYYNNWLKLMNAQLDQETLACDQLCKIIISHEKELIRRLSHFAILEDETDEDKCMIDERSDLSIASQVARLF
jgi:hypothetical protein